MCYRCWFGAVFLVVSVGAAPSLAAEKTYRSDYSIMLLGIPIAHSSFVGTFDGKQFSVDGKLRSSGLARIFDDTEGITKAKGLVHTAKVEPRSYSMSYRSGSKKKSTTIGFRNGRVIDTVNKPKSKQKPAKWVPVSNEHLAAVADPLTATLVKASKLNEVCNRTIRMFDGAMRADLQMKHMRTKQIATQGYKGEAVDCAVRFVPVSGYRKGHSGTEFMSKNLLQVTFAPLGQTGVFAPIAASIPTKIGALRIFATRFGVVE